MKLKRLIYFVLLVVPWLWAWSAVDTVKSVELEINRVEIGLKLEIDRVEIESLLRGNRDLKFIRTLQEFIKELSRSYDSNRIRIEIIEQGRANL